MPAIFENDGKYHDEASRYLRDRAFGRIDEHHTPLSPNSMATISRSLCHFLNWCVTEALRPERRRLGWSGWKDVDYLNDLVFGYQSSMIKANLAPSTINLRVHEAGIFCEWAFKVGLRSIPFKILWHELSYRGEGVKSYSHRQQLTQRRVGQVRIHPKHLRMPSEQEILVWLSAVKIRWGEAKALMCELAFRGALRRNEIVQWRSSYLTDSKNCEWGMRNPYIGECVRVFVTHGTKGSKSRWVLIPRDLANRLEEYRKKSRARARQKYIIAGENREVQLQRMTVKEDRLFLSAHTGLPVSYHSFYEAWTNVRVKPYSNWSPHLGRHYWVCMTLLDEVRKSRALLAKGVTPTGDWISGQAASIMDMLIIPQMGHMGAQSIHKYKVWLQTALLDPEEADRYQGFLEQGLQDE